jgi:CysZ protein
VEIPWLDRDRSDRARLGIGSTRLFNNARGADLAQLDSLDRGRGRSHRAPAASLVAGFYLDNIADTVERKIDPQGARGHPSPLSIAICGAAIRRPLPPRQPCVPALTLFTGVGFVGFFVLNGYLLGREYFELAAMRHLPFPEAVNLRRQRSFDVFIAGMIVAVFVAVPLLNLFTPLFATAFMTRTVKRLA